MGVISAFSGTPNEMCEDNNFLLMQTLLCFFHLKNPG